MYNQEEELSLRPFLREAGEHAAVSSFFFQTAFAPRRSSQKAAGSLAAAHLQAANYILEAAEGSETCQEPTGR